MENLFYNIGQVLGITIIHSLWQGLVVYLLLRLIFLALPSLSADKKHNQLFAGLSILCVWFAITFFITAKNYDWPVEHLIHITQLNRAFPVIAPQTTTLLPDQPDKLTALKLMFFNALKAFMPYLAAIYIIGLCVNLVRLTMGWQKIRMIKHELTVTLALQKHLLTFKQKMSIVKPVRVSFSPLVDVPCTIGYLKPILLLPITITTQLSTDQVEAVLLHELAHIRNNDYLLNLIQQVMTILLYLNPFAQLISRMIAAERENRCDDAVVELTGKPLIYARALVTLEETRQTDLQLALAATGKKYQLLARVERMMKAKKPVVNVKHLVLMLVIFIGSVGSIAWLNPEVKNGRIISERGAQAVVKLAAMVKKVMEPLKPPVEQSAANHHYDKQDIANPISDIDTTKKAIAPASHDTLKYILKHRDAVIREYNRAWQIYSTDQQVVKKLPETKLVDEAYRVYDSVMAKVSKAMPQEFIEEHKKNSAASINALYMYWRSAEYTDMMLKRKSLAKKLDSLQRSLPEMIQYNERIWRGRDSVEKTLEPLHLSRDSVNKIVVAWSRNTFRGSSVLFDLTTNDSRIKPRYDSLMIVLNRINQSIKAREDEIRKTFSDNDKQYQDHINQALAPYRAALDVAKAELHVTQAYKKQQEDYSKVNEIKKRIREDSANK